MSEIALQAASQIALCNMALRIQVQHFSTSN
jgi:hypothetical protein